MSETTARPSPCSSANGTAICTVGSGTRRRGGSSPYRWATRTATGRRSGRVERPRSSVRAARSSWPTRPRCRASSGSTGGTGRLTRAPRRSLRTRARSNCGHASSSPASTCPRYLVVSGTVSSASVAVVQSTSAAGASVQPSAKVSGTAPSTATSRSYVRCVAGRRSGVTMRGGSCSRATRAAASRCRSSETPSAHWLRTTVSTPSGLCTGR